MQFLGNQGGFPQKVKLFAEGSTATKKRTAILTSHPFRGVFTLVASAMGAGCLSLPHMFSRRAQTERPEP